MDLWMRNKAEHIIQHAESSRASLCGGVSKISRHLPAPVCQFIFREEKLFLLATTGRNPKMFLYFGGEETADERFLLCLMNSYLRLHKLDAGRG